MDVIRELYGKLKKQTLDKDKKTIIKYRLLVLANYRAKGLREINEEYRYYCSLRGCLELALPPKKAYVRLHNTIYN